MSELEIRGATLTAVDVKAQVQLIQQVMEATMVNGTHYGTIPGCGDKPALLKPGAEKLCSTFRMAPDPIVEDLSDSDCVKYRVTCRMLSQLTGAFLGSGVGEASSDEEKYRWKKPVCDQEWAEAPEDRKREKWTKGYGNKPDYKQKQIRTNPADIDNTILKMAKKRALIDGVLTITAASDIFIQDLDDDLPPGDKGQAAAKPTTDKIITKPQLNRLYAIAKGKGLDHNDIKANLEAQFNYTGHVADEEGNPLLPRSLYEPLCDGIAKMPTKPKAKVEDDPEAAVAAQFDADQGQLVD